MWTKILVENCRICGRKLSYIWSKIVVYMVENCRLYTACIVYNAHIIARITIVTLRQHFRFSAIVDIIIRGALLIKWRIMHCLLKTLYTMTVRNAHRTFVGHQLLSFNEPFWYSIFFSSNNTVFMALSNLTTRSEIISKSEATPTI